MSTNATLPQAGHVLTLIGEKGVTKDQLTGAVSDGTLPDFLEAIANGFGKSREELRSFLGLGPLVLKIVVDYSMTLAEMIVAGRYDWKNDDITAERFPIMGKGKKEIAVELIHFNRNISSDDVERELDKMGLRSATIEELLAFGATFPETQRKFSIIALGSVARIDGYRYVAFLRRIDSGRNLYLRWRDDDWSEIVRFLAVRK
jgi:hypothetical protein